MKLSYTYKLCSSDMIDLDRKEVRAVTRSLYGTPKPGSTYGRSRNLAETALAETETRQKLIERQFRRRNRRRSRNSVGTPVHQLTSAWTMLRFEQQQEKVFQQFPIKTKKAQTDEFD